MERSNLDSWNFGTLHGSDSDPVNRHPDFVAISTASTYGTGDSFPGITPNPSDLIDAENRVIWEGLQVREEMSNYSAETRAILDDICNSVSFILDDISGDFGDFAADLEEMI